MVLTNEYQYIGRSNSVSCPAGWKYYILLYAKASGDTSTGRHTVSVKMRIAANVDSTFYDWCTTGSATVGGESAFSWSWSPIPGSPWEKSSITEGGYTYPRWIDLKEGSVVVNTGYGVTKDVTIAASWVMKDSSSYNWFPATGTYARASVTVTLPMISSGSTITSASNVVLGNNCSITWTPIAASFRYKLTFRLGAFSYTTGIIHPNKTTAYTYTGYAIPLTVANQIPNDPSGTMRVTLSTYSDSNATVQVGVSNTATFTVTVPDNNSTKPRVTVTISPVGDLPSAFNGIYVAGRTKVKVSYSATSLYSTIASYNTSIDGKSSNANPYTSAILSNSGSVTIGSKVTDARGYFTESASIIQVIPYARPRIIPAEGQRNIVCTRCNSDGTVDPGGVYLLVKLGRKYEKVISGGSQKNYCKISYRYKQDSESESRYSSWVTLLDKTATSDYVFAVLPNVVSSNTIAYNIQFIAEDDMGEKDTITITVPTAFVTFHIPEGGHGLTLGGYHDPDKEDVFDCKFDAEFHGSVSGSVMGLQGSSGDIPSDGDLNDYRVPGVYAVSTDAAATTIENMPSAVRRAGLLRVYASLGQDNVNEGNWKYITQEYRSLIAGTPDYRRRMWTDGTGTWSYGAWVSGIDDVFHLAGTATQMNAHIYTSNNVETCQFAIRASSDIYVLNCTPSGLQYSKNGTVLWTK